MIRTEALSGRSLAVVIACALLVLVAGYAYAILFSFNIKVILSVHAAVILFFGTAVFAKDFKAFILFALIFMIPFGLDAIYSSDDYYSCIPTFFYQIAGIFPK